LLAVEGMQLKKGTLEGSVRTQSPPFMKKAGRKPLKRTRNDYFAQNKVSPSKSPKRVTERFEGF
jgi:hypothetical protein